MRDLDNDLAPGSSSSQSDKCILDPIQADELLVCELGAAQLALLDEVHDAVPHHGDGLPLVDAVSAPVNSDQGDVLEEHLVHGDLFDGAAGEPHDQDAAVPGGAFGRLVDQADGVVDDVDALGLGRQLLDLGGPLRVVVRDDVIGAERLGHLELARSGSGGDDGSAERLGNCIDSLAFTNILLNVLILHRGKHLDDAFFS